MLFNLVTTHFYKDLCLVEEQVEIYFLFNNK